MSEAGAPKPGRRLRENDRWQNLTVGALRLEEQLALRDRRGLSQTARAQLLQALLDNVLEVFPSTLDPVDDFEGFAVRRFAQALQRALVPDTNVVEERAPLPTKPL